MKKDKNIKKDMLDDFNKYKDLNVSKVSNDTIKEYEDSLEGY